MPRLDHRFQYQQIAQEIKGRVLRGELPAGRRLESERVLGAQYQVQRNTIRQALDLLEREGCIAKETRRGSFVLPIRKEQAGGTFLVNIRGTGELYEGFCRGAHEAGFSVLRCAAQPHGNSTIENVPDPEHIGSDTAGIVLWPRFPTDPARIQQLFKLAPIVLIDRHVPGVAADCVHFDDLAGGKLVTEHLLNLGHRRIAFLTDEVFADTVQLRWHGYVLALENAGISYDPMLSLLYQTLNVDILSSTMRLLMADPNRRPTAVVCSNDLVAFSLLSYLLAEHIRVPGDLAVTGYGNSIPDYTAAMTLTTVDQPFYEAGYQAAKILAERAVQAPEERLRRPRDLALPVRLIPRASTMAK